MKDIKRTGAMNLSLRTIGILFALICALSVSAAASTVGCSGASGTFDYNSLNAALAAANPGGDTITVSGTCTELVAIYNFNNLAIVGTPGAALVEPLGNNFQGDVIDIGDSQNLLIAELRIQANPHTPDTYIPVVGVGNSSVTFRNNTIEGSAQTDGIDVYPASNVTIRGGTIENHPDGAGIFAGGSGANVNLRSGPGSTCPIIQNNADGIYVVANASVNIRQCAIIRDNWDIGIAGDSGASVDVNNPQNTPGAIQVLNSSFGIYAGPGGTLSAGGPMLIQGHSAEGVRVRAARGRLFATAGGSLGPTITQNGFGAPICCLVNAGVGVVQGATLDITAASITGNSAPGLHITDNSSVRLFGAGAAGGTFQITANQAGVELQNSSVAQLAGAPLISGNGTDLSCTSDARAYGDGSGVGRMNCPGFQSQSNPGLGSKGKIVY